MHRSTNGLAAKSPATDHAAAQVTAKLDKLNLGRRADQELHKWMPHLKVIQDRLMTRMPPSPQPRCRVFGTDLAALEPIVDEHGFHVEFGGYRLDFASSGAIRVFSSDHLVAVAVNIASKEMAVMHAQCHAYSDGETVEMLSDGRMAKLSARGVMFRLDYAALGYLVDEGGCKTNSDRIRALQEFDFTSIVLFSHNEKFVNRLVPSNTYRHSHADDSWMIAGYRVCIRGKELTVSKATDKMLVVVHDDGTIKARLGDTRFSLGYTHINVSRTDDQGKPWASVRIRDRKLAAQFKRQEAGFDRHDELYVR